MKPCRTQGKAFKHSDFFLLNFIMDLKLHLALGLKYSWRRAFCVFCSLWNLPIMHFRVDSLLVGFKLNMNRNSYLKRVSIQIFLRPW